MSLSREAEGTGPVMPGNLIFIKVPIPADYPKDEVLCRFVFGAAFSCFRTYKTEEYKNVKNVIYI